MFVDFHLLYSLKSTISGGRIPPGYVLVYTYIRIYISMFSFFLFTYFYPEDLKPPIEFN